MDVRQSDRSLREAFRGAVRARVGQARFATWFEGGVAIAIGRNSADGAPEARLITESAFEQGLLRKQMHGDLMAAAAETLGPGARVAFAVESPSVAEADRTSHAAATRVPPRPRAASKAAERGAPAPITTIAERPAPLVAGPEPAGESAPVPDDWVVGDSNAAATRLCARMIAGRPGPSPTLLWGPSGVGKTQLLQRLADGLRSRRRRVVAVSAEQFLRGFVDAVRGGGFPGFRQKYDGLDALVVDDIQLLLGKKKTVEEFRQTIDAMIQRGAPVVLSADRGPGELRELGPEMASRLAGGLSVEVQSPDVPMRERLAYRAAQRLGVELPPAAAATLARTLVGGGREVSGAINRLVLLHETFGSPLDERLAEQVAQDSNRLSTPPVRLADIQRAVCGVFGLDAKTLRSEKRTKAVTEPRMLAMFLARKLTGSAWSEIGDFFGRKSHSTVIAAHRRVEALLSAAQPTRLVAGELGETIRRVEAALRSA